MRDMRDVQDMGQQMGYRSLQWNWLKEAIIIIIIKGHSLRRACLQPATNTQNSKPKEAMNIPIGAGIVDGAKLF